MSARFAGHIMRTKANAINALEMRGVYERIILQKYKKQ